MLSTEIFSGFGNNLKNFALKRETSVLNKEIRKTVVIGASPRPYRYSHSAVVELQRSGHPVIAIGLREESIGTVPILTGFPEVEDVHTVTLYVGPKKQPHYYDYILRRLAPKRIIMNPGTENDELISMAKEKDIEVVENCTLMMLAYGMY